MIKAEEILNLIELKQEGSYWDFKKQWYEDGHEGDLLHDIICMANNLVNREAYIIIGVDEEKDYCAYDVDNDSHRRTTQNLVDFLRDKKFAGDVRPLVTVEPCKICEYNMNVIVVHNSTETPYYLKESFRQVRPHNIYVRVQDTNTPIDRSADISHIEYLWKKRFGMIQTPIEKMQQFLMHRDMWERCPGYEEQQYYRWAPEYTIGYPLDDPENRDGYEFYILNQTDSRPHWTIIQLKYHQTILRDMSGIMLDGGRHFSPCPLIDGVYCRGYGSWDVSYRYWTKDSLEYTVHLFYLDPQNSEAMWSERLLMENVLLFEDENEHQYFNWYVEKHWHQKDMYAKDIREPYVEEIPGYNMDAFKEQIINSQILQRMLIEFRKENSSMYAH